MNIRNCLSTSHAVLRVLTCDMESKDQTIKNLRNVIAEEGDDWEWTQMSEQPDHTTDTGR